MLPTFQLQIAGPAGSNALNVGQPGQAATVPVAGSTAPEASFADLLRAPVLVAWPAEGGQPLPVDGNPLPDADLALPLSADAPDQAIDGAERLPLPALIGRALNRETGADLPPRDLPGLEAGAEDRVPDPIPLTSAAGGPAILIPDSDLTPARRPAPVLPNALPVVDAQSGSPERSAYRSPVPTIAVDPVTPTANPESVSAERLLSIGPTAQATVNATSPVQAPPLSALSAAAPVAPSSAPSTPLQTTIALPVSDPGWGDALGERVLVLSARGGQSAEIRLSPAELGPIRVTIAVEDAAANVSFNAQHAVTREAIEAALPRLREMLSEQGLTLGNASVDDHSAHGDQRQRPTAKHDGGPATADAPSQGELSDGRGADTVRVSRGLIDTFA